MDFSSIIHQFPNEKLNFLTRHEAENYKTTSQACHVLIYAKTGDLEIFNVDRVAAFALVVIRHDGLFGFPGGFVNEGETWEEAANRELMEELNFDLSQNKIKSSDYLFTSFEADRNWLFHFYSLPISMEDFVRMEMQIHKATHYGSEILGFSRIPYYITDRGLGLPNFLHHNFVGNSKQELIVSSILTGIVDKNHMSEALKIGLE